MRILIADDDHVTRHMLELSIAKWGFEPVITCDGDEAWQIVERKDAPQIFILDWVMPGIDGLEICRRVRNRHLQIQPYIILLTAQNKKEDIAAGLDAGADDYITKPFHNAELRARINAGIRVVGLQNALACEIEQLQNAIEQIRTLKGLIPICSHCKKIRDDKGYWESLEKYISQHTEAEFSHGICDECMKKYYSDVMRAP